MTGALDGIRILDLTDAVAGPLGVLLLAGQGADVIKVEPPGGGPGRTEPGSSVWNRSRRSIELDLSTPDGHATILRPVIIADVVVESQRPGEMAGLGPGFDDLAAVNPCSVPAYPPGHRAGGRGRSTSISERPAPPPPCSPSPFATGTAIVSRRLAAASIPWRSRSTSTTVTSRSTTATTSGSGQWSTPSTPSWGGSVTSVPCARSRTPRSRTAPRFGTAEIGAALVAGVVAEPDENDAWSVCVAPPTANEGDRSH